MQDHPTNQIKDKLAKQTRLETKQVQQNGKVDNFICCFVV